MKTSDDSDQYDVFDSDPKFVAEEKLEADEKEMGIDGQLVESDRPKKKLTWNEEMNEVKHMVGADQKPKT